MDQLKLYLNDQLADLSDDSPIALTFQINNLAEVQNQQGNTSNQFKIPLTQRNRQILGFPDDVPFTTNLPYQKYQAKLVQDGLEIIPYGVAQINGIDQDTANITILSGNVDFFDAIGGKLYDMGDSTSPWSNYGQNLVWKPYDHVWNLDNVANAQNKVDNRGLNVSNTGQTTLNHPSVLKPAAPLMWNTINSDQSNQFSGNTLFTANDINSVSITVTFPHVFLHGRVTPQQNSSKLSTYIYYRDPNYPATPDA